MTQRTTVSESVWLRLPSGVRRLIQRARRAPYVPAPNTVRFGDLRRTSPIARDFGYKRGGPIDRTYIESFLDSHRSDIRGRVLEVGDASYTEQFGSGVTASDVLNVYPDAAGTTICADLGRPNSLPFAAFDCIILTQTLHLIFDVPTAIDSTLAALRPGGVALVTVPGITNIDPGEWGSTWYYSFTHHWLQRAFSRDGYSVDVQSYGNVLSAISFLHGLGRDELTAAEREALDVNDAVIHAARITRLPGSR